MQGKKHYQEKLFVSFQLSGHVPEDNFYRRLKGLLDLSFVYKSTAKHYGTEGQKSIDPVVFMKLMLVGYLENLNSDRRIIGSSSMRLDIRFFIGYGLDEELPWHSTLSRTRQLYGQEAFTEVFRSVLKLCIDKGMVSGKRQAVDGVFVKASASLGSMAEREVLEDAGAFGKELEANSEQGAPAAKSEGSKGKKPSNSTHYSPADPDAKMSTKPGKPTALNYLGEVCVDTGSHAITHIQAFTADKSDGDCLPEVLKGLAANLKENGLAVEEVVAGTGFSNGGALKALEESGITGYIPNRPQFAYEKPGFVYDSEGDHYTCPNNKKLTYRGTYKDPGGSDKVYRGERKACRGCPFMAGCAAYKKRDTVITETIDKPYYDRMHQRMQPQGAERMMKLRQSTVEPVIGTLVNYLGMRRVNTKGLALANKCLTMAAVAYNVKKLLKCSAGCPQKSAGGGKKGFWQRLHGFCQRLWGKSYPGSHFFSGSSALQKSIGYF